MGNVQQNIVDNQTIRNITLQLFMINNYHFILDKYTKLLNKYDEVSISGKYFENIMMLKISQHYWLKYKVYPSGVNILWEFRIIILRYFKLIEK